MRFPIASLALCALTAVASAQARPAAVNLPRTVLPLIRDLENNTIGSMGVIGDSISYRTDSYHWFMRQRFWADFGSAGDGFVSPTNMNGSCSRVGIRCGIGISRNANAVVGDASGPRDSFGRKTVEGQYMRIYNTPQLNGEADLFVLGSKLRVHYIEGPNGGRFEFRQNGSVVQQVDTRVPNIPERHASLTLSTGLTDPDTNAEFQIRALSGNESFFQGFEMRSGTPGFIYHRLARGGAGPRDFLRGATDTSAGLLRALDLDLLGVMLDWAPNERPTYMDEMNQYLDWLEAQLPGVKIVLISHHPFINTMRQQSDMLLEIARQRGHGYINLADTFADYDEMNALGFMEDVVHLTAAGGEWFGNYVYELLREAGDIALTADVNEDALFDFFDVTEYLNRFGSGDPRADLTDDGALDFFDVQEFLTAFQLAVK